MVAEIKPNGTDKIRAYSVDLKEYAIFGLNEEDKPEPSWACYIFGVAREIIKRGFKVEGLIQLSVVMYLSALVFHLQLLWSQHSLLR